MASGRASIRSASSVARSASRRASSEASSLHQPLWFWPWKLFSSVGICSQVKFRREVLRVGLRRRDVHRQVVVEAGQALLEDLFGGAVVGDDVEASRAQQRDHVGLGVLTAEVAGVDHPADLRHRAVLLPQALAVLRPPVAGQQLVGAARVVRALERCPPGSRGPGRPRAAVEQLAVDAGRGVDRRVDLLEQRLAVDRLGNASRNTGVGERALQLLEVESPRSHRRAGCRSRCSDRHASRCRWRRRELRVDEVDLAGRGSRRPRCPGRSAAPSRPCSATGGSPQ